MSVYVIDHAGVFGSCRSPGASLPSCLQTHPGAVLANPRTARMPRLGSTAPQPRARSSTSLEKRGRHETNPPGHERPMSPESPSPARSRPGKTPGTGKVEHVSLRFVARSPKLPIVGVYRHNCRQRCQSWPNKGGVRQLVTLCRPPRSGKTGHAAENHVFR